MPSSPDCAPTHSAPRPRSGTREGNGERLCNQRGRITPQAPALRASHSRVWRPPYDPGRQPGVWPPRGTRHTWPFLDSCHPTVSEPAGPGGAPAAKRGRTTWRYGETTAILGREEGQEPCLLTQRGIRSAWLYRWRGSLRGRADTVDLRAAVARLSSGSGCDRHRRATP